MWRRAWGAHSFSSVRLFGILRTAAHQAPLSMVLQEEYGSRLSLALWDWTHFSCLAGGSFTSVTWEVQIWRKIRKISRNFVNAVAFWPLIRLFFTLILSWGTPGCQQRLLSEPPRRWTDTAKAANTLADLLGVDKDSCAHPSNRLGQG